MKLCRQCNQQKPRSEYYAADGNLDGKMGKCKECHKARQQHLRKAYPADRLMKPIERRAGQGVRP